MVDIQKTNGILRNIFIVVMVTVIPVAIIVRLWLVIVTYWQLILSLFLIGVGVIFIYFYFKAYNLKTIVLKIKKFIRVMQGLEEDVPSKTMSEVIAERSRSFLIIGLCLELSGFYFLSQFVKNH